jgi:copper(I)-binding protein
MRLFVEIAALLIAAAISASASAAPGDIQIADAKARPTPPGAATAAVYLTIVNRGAADDTLTGVATPVAETAAAHRTGNANGVMTMEAAPDLPVKAGGSVAFTPGGLHIMLTGLKQPLTKGETFPITLTFAVAGPVTATVTVGPVGKPAHDPNAMPGMKM